MNIGYTGLYESYLEYERKLREYQKRQAARLVPVARIEIDESDFARTISVTADGRVFYLDHVLLWSAEAGAVCG